MSGEESNLWSMCVLHWPSQRCMLYDFTRSNSLYETHDLWIVSTNLSFSLIKYMISSVSSQHWWPCKSDISWPIDVFLYENLREDCAASMLYLSGIAFVEQINFHCYLLSLGEHFFLGFGQNKNLSPSGQDKEIMLNTDLLISALFNQ